MDFCIKIILIKKGLRYSSYQSFGKTFLIKVFKISLINFELFKFEKNFLIVSFSILSF